MKTVTGKGFRKLFNLNKIGFYLCEFKLLREFDPLFPVSVGKELKPGCKNKFEVWREEDAELYAKYIDKKEELKKNLFIQMVNHVWAKTYPVEIYAIEERINLRTKRREAFKNETAQEKQRKLSIMLEDLKDLESKIAIIESVFKTEKDLMHYYYDISDIERYISDCDSEIHRVAEFVKSVIQCIDYIEKNNKASCDEFYASSYECLDDDQENLNYLNKLRAEDTNKVNNLIRENELLELSLKDLHQRLVSNKNNR